MARGFHVTATIDRPQSDVWAFMTDLTNAPAWMKGIERIAPLTDNAMRAGARFHTVSNAGGRGIARETELAVWEPMSRFALKFEQSGISAVYEYCCTADGGRTKVALDARCTARGIVWRLLHPLIAHMMRRHDGDQLERLRQVLEEGR